MKFDDDADAEIERCIKNTLKEDETKNTYTMARRVKKVSPKIKVSHTLHSADDQEGTRILTGEPSSSLIAVSR